MKTSKRQKEIMSFVLQGDVLGWIDIDMLMDKLAVSSSVASKQSVQCSIRILEEHGMLQREYITRRGKSRMTLVPTAKGTSYFLI